MLVINETCRFQIIDGLLTIHAQNGPDFDSVSLNSSYIKSGPRWLLNMRKSCQSCRDLGDWRLINISNSNSTVAKTYLISFSILQQFVDADEDDRESTIVSAARHGDIEEVRDLLLEGSISDKIRGKATKKAAKRGHQNIVNLLLWSGLISDEHRGKATLQAVAGGYIHIVNSLLRSGSISDEHRGKATLQAVAGGYIHIVNSLLRSGLISDEHRGQATLQAVAGGYINIVNSLLRSGSISDEHRRQATLQAVARGYSAIGLLLPPDGSNSRDFRDFPVEEIDNPTVKIDEIKGRA